MTWLDLSLPSHLMSDDVSYLMSLLPHVSYLMSDDGERVDVALLASHQQTFTSILNSNQVTMWDGIELWSSFWGNSKLPLTGKLVDWWQDVKAVGLGGGGWEVKRWNLLSKEFRSGPEASFQLLITSPLRLHITLLPKLVQTKVRQLEDKPGGKSEIEQRKTRHK